MYFSQTLNLEISTPQPRLNQEFNILINVQEIRNEIFKSFENQVELVNDFLHISDPTLRFTVNPKKLGMSEIGPLNFTFNGKAYTTNKISFEVIGKLPDVTSGLWFRKVKINDTTFYILIDQNIPSVSKTIDSTANSWTRTMESKEKAVEFKYFPDTQFYPTDGLLKLSIGGSRSNSGKAYINGVSANYIYNFHLAKCVIKKNGTARITKDYFQNLPVDYKFEDIILE